MDSKQEIELFNQLSGNSRFKGWLQHMLEKEFLVLSQQTDIDQLRRAQGRAQLLKSMADLLEQAPAAARR